MAAIITPPLAIEEEDGSPSGYPTTLKVTNGSLTDNGDGSFSLSVSSTLSMGDAITGGTVGSVIFVGAGPVLAQDNAKFFWDDTNDVLNIGSNTGTIGKLWIVGDGDETQVTIRANSTQSITNPLISLQKSDGTVLTTIHSNDASNLFVGSGAGDAITTGTDCICIGQDAGTALTTSTQCIAIGTNSLITATAGSLRNVAVGVDALRLLDGGDDCVAIGWQAGRNISTGTKNTCIGNQAGRNLTTGGSNVCVGHLAGDKIGANNFNVCVGTNTNLGPNAQDNMVLGYWAGQNLDGDNNVAIGSTAMSLSVATDVAGCVAIGRAALTSLQASANFNIAIGFEAGNDITTGTDNLLIGYQAGDLITTGSGNILIGNSLDTPTITTSNYLQIGDCLTGDISTGTAVGAALQITTGATTTSNLFLKQIASQTADMFQLLDSTGSVMGVIDSNGYLGIGASSPATPIESEEETTITGAVGDGYAATVTIDPGYTAATAQTVTRHNYIDMQNVSLAGAGPAALTDACVMRFDAAAGTHKAVDSGTTKSTPGTVDAWVKINVNGTIYYVPSYTSKTS